MKARIPKSFDVLPRAQKEAVAEFIRDTAKQIAATAYERGLRSTITLMVKMSCIILHEQYGFGKVRLMQFLTAWQRQFPRELELLERGERTAYHEDMMRRLFGDPKLLDGYMDYIYRQMEKLEEKSEGGTTMYNYTCPACGATLDPGEKCDCGGEGAKKFGSPDTNQTDPKTAPTGNIPVDKTSIAQNFAFVKGVDVRKLRIAKKIPARAMVETVRKRFPGYDTTLQSKIERPDYYGVRLLPEAEAALIREFAPEVVQDDRKKDRHKIPNRVSFRPPDGLYALLIRYASDEHYSSMNACLIDLVRMALAKKTD